MFIHSLFGGCWHRSHLLAIAHRVAVNIHVQVFVGTLVFRSFGDITRSGVAGS